MKRTALALVLLAALATTLAPLSATEAPNLKGVFAAETTAQCLDATLDLAKIDQAAEICQLCPQQQGEVCQFEGQECGLGTGCSCQRSGSLLACCV